MRNQDLLFLCRARVILECGITGQWQPAVILKSLVARASRAVLEFRISHMFNLLQLDNAAKIFEVIFDCHPPFSPLVWLTFRFSEMLISLVNQNQSKETERKFNVPEI